MPIPINNQLIPSLITKLESLSITTQELAQEREIPTKNPRAFSRRLREEIFKNLQAKNVKTQSQKDSLAQSLHGIIGHYTDWNKTKAYFKRTVDLIVAKVVQIEEDLRTLASASQKSLSGYDQALKKFVTQSKRYLLDHNHRRSKNYQIDKSNEFKWNLFRVIDPEKKPLSMNNGYNPSNPAKRTYNADIPISVYED